jgi:hypothetical protein
MGFLGKDVEKAAQLRKWKSLARSWLYECLTNGDAEYSLIMRYVNTGNPRTSLSALDFGDPSETILQKAARLDSCSKVFAALLESCKTSKKLVVQDLLVRACKYQRVEHVQIIFEMFPRKAFFCENCYSYSGNIFKEMLLARFNKYNNHPLIYCKNNDELRATIVARIDWELQAKDADFVDRCGGVNRHLIIPINSLNKLNEKVV